MDILIRRSRTLTQYCVHNIDSMRFICMQEFRFPLTTFYILFENCFRDPVMSKQIALFKNGHDVDFRRSFIMLEKGRKRVCMLVLIFVWESHCNRHTSQLSSKAWLSIVPLIISPCNDVTRSSAIDQETSSPFKRSPVSLLIFTHDTSQLSNENMKIINRSWGGRSSIEILINGLLVVLFEPMSVLIYIGIPARAWGEWVSSL